jgi:hypothetical protein
VKLYQKALIMFAILCFDMVQHAMVSATELPKVVVSSASQKPPVIDGKIGVEEWRAAPVQEFDMPMLFIKEKRLSKRACQLRVMNSANGLYVAMKVPDATLNKSLAPLDFDFVSLAFCRGTELAAGDDRKAVAPGIYLDKHFVSAGKEVDDKQVDGKGMMIHDQAAGVYTIEWAMPLNSGDKDDVQAKPGDELRFNLAYVDAFQADLKETQMGAAYSGGLDVAKNWGVLKLAADVPEDNGSALRGPEWMRQQFEAFSTIPAKRMRVVDSSLLPALGGPVAKIQVEYTFRNFRGKDVTGKAKFYLPTDGERFKTNLPLYYSAGYELDDGSALGHVARGFAAVTPQALEANPLVRTVNPDVALLHLARALPLIDDARVVVGGGSAGGYATLLVSAETFPLAGAVPGVPPVNWGYNAAYFLQRERAENRKDPTAPKTPVFDAIVPIVFQGTKVYGDNPNAEIYFRHSPIAHLDTVTCPVSVYWTTADMLVPIDQVGKQWVRPFDATKFPAGFTFDPDKLMSSPQGRQRFIDALKPSDYEVFVISEEVIQQHLSKLATVKAPSELAFSTTKQWSITILDEGSPEPQLGHTKYAVPWSQLKFIDHVAGSKIAPTQLTAPKLARLMDRFAGREWLPTELVHLDVADTERADVIRGLKTYLAAGDEHRKVFTELYAMLPTEKQVLPAEVLKELLSGKAP